MASGGDKFIYLLVGGVVGASVALLFAPQTGEQTRAFLDKKYGESTGRLSETAKKGKEQIKGKSAEMAGKVTQNIHKGKEILQQQKDQLSAAIEASKDAYKTELDNLKDLSPREQE